MNRSNHQNSWKQRLSHTLTKTKEVQWGLSNEEGFKNTCFSLNCFFPFNSWATPKRIIFIWILKTPTTFLAPQAEEVLCLNCPLLSHILDSGIVEWMNCEFSTGGNQGEAGTHCDKATVYSFCMAWVVVWKLRCTNKSRCLWMTPWRQGWMHRAKLKWWSLKKRYSKTRVPSFS